MPFGSRLAWLSLLILVACGSSTSDGGGSGNNSGPTTENPGNTPPGETPPGTTPPPATARSLAIAADTVVMRRGKSAPVKVTITRNGFAGVVDLSISGLPAGVSTKSPATATAGETTTTLVLDATKDAALGKTKIAIAAKSGADLTAKTEIDLVVADGQKLDPTFGTGGMLTYWPDMQNRWPHALAVQPDAKILVTCQYDVTPEGVAPDLVGGVYRFTDSGAVDPSFGTNGLVQIPAFGGGTNMALQTDGKIVLCGSGKSDKKLTLARLTTSGALDTTFGAGGTGIVKGPAGLPSCSGLALDASGRYVLTSYLPGSGSAPSTSSAVVARYLPSGALDTTFGNAGTGTTTTTLGGKTGSLRDVRVTPQGSLFFTGSRQMEGTTYVRGIVAKMSSAGVLDATFGTNGVYENTYSIFEALPLPGDSALFGIQNEVFRLTPQGTLDTSYTLEKGPPGGNSLSFGLSVLDAQQMQYRFRWTTISWAAELWAYNPNGSRDTSFADGGRIALQPGMETSATDITIAPDGRLVVLAGSGAAIWLARFVL